MTEDSLESLRTELNLLSEDPPTILEITGLSEHEEYYEKLLYHFLRPEEAHGFDGGFLEHFLRALSRRDDILSEESKKQYEFSDSDIDTAYVERQKDTDQGRPDLIISTNESLICIEIKIYSPESDEQTHRYTDIEWGYIQGIQRGQKAYYLYLAPEDNLPSNDEGFVHVSWRWITSEIQSFLTNNSGRIPHRSVKNMSELVNTIQRELDMTGPNINKKAKLFAEYKNEIEEVAGGYADNKQSIIDNIKEEVEKSDFYDDEWNTEEQSQNDTSWEKIKYASDWVKFHPEDWHIKKGGMKIEMEYEPHVKIAEEGGDHHILIRVDGHDKNNKNKYENQRKLGERMKNLLPDEYEEEIKGFNTCMMDKKGPILMQKKIYFDEEDNPVEKTRDEIEKIHDEIEDYLQYMAKKLEDEGKEYLQKDD